MMHEAVLILMRLFRLIACVIAYHRSTVMMVNVNTDKCVENMVKNPATRQPAPAIENILINITQRMIQMHSTWLRLTICQMAAEQRTPKRIIPNWIISKHLIKLATIVHGKCWLKSNYAWERRTMLLSDWDKGWDKTATFSFECTDKLFRQNWRRELGCEQI